ncbi:monovalent cation/H(+) antiporter subunit G [Aeromicrobium sp. 50.2.37]|uniref:cation:proton antiporter n=1 Tax=Aeromicrobium sp. 50.2.37 TaxID=2969305 RepID=UPI00214FB8F6|nr:monovalent cation/H(+) antiporter subunit G [Aeromicrobium sp. 50.2.37]MCR4513436.1 monovalent cation/H(+) antiporter subunit G [Aeromicrobium sp. 50.2.37]
MTTVLEVLGQVFLLVGAAVFVLAAVGLITLFDPYTRTSAVATAAGVGLSFIVVGIVLLDPSVSNGIKAALAVVLQLVTSAVGSMAIARGAVLTGHAFEQGTDATELHELHDPEARRDDR